MTADTAPFRLTRYLAGIAAFTLLAGGTTIALAQAGQDVPPVAAGAPAEQPAAPPARPRAPPPTTLHSRPGATGGEALYLEKCAMCHGPNGMGTGLLGRTRPVALLEARDNLPAAYVVLAARQGIGNMPAIPRGEASDAQLQSIADYLAAGPHVDAQGKPL